MKIINPATEELISELPEDDPLSIENKFHLLREAQSAWQGLRLQERIGILKKFGILLKENIESLAAILTAEVGKPLQQSKNEINGATTRIKWLSENAEKYLS